MMKRLVGVLLAGLCAVGAQAVETSVVWKENGRQPVRVRVAPEERKVAARDAKSGLSGKAGELLAMWGVEDAAGELSERLREVDFLGREHVRYRQVYKGLEVDGRELIVHWKDGAVYEVNGDFLGGVAVGVEPSVGAEEAVVLAAGGVAGGAASGRSPVLVVWCAGEDGAAARLAWRVRVDAPGSGEFAGRKVGWFVFVDARKGRVLDARMAGMGKGYGEGDDDEEEEEEDVCNAASTAELKMHAITNEYPAGAVAEIKGALPWQLGGEEVAVTGIEDGDGRQLLACTDRYGVEVAVYEGFASPRFRADAQKAWALGDKEWFEGFHTNIAFVEYRPEDTASMPQDAMAIAYNVARVLEWMQDAFGRSSYDGQGGRVACWQFWNDNGAALSEGYENAFWSSEETEDGEPYGNFFFGYDCSGARCEASFDTCGHELTHGVTSCTADLQYQGESGALNESFSDLFAVACEFACQPRAADPLAPGRGEADWLFDEDASGDWENASRSYADPTWKDNPSRYGGTYWINPATPQDNGGVHYNSGVQNHFFYLLCEGGRNPVDGVCENDGTQYAWFPGIGMEKATPLVYLALTSYCGPMTRYRDVVQCWLSAAEDLLEEGRFTEDDVETVRKAWAAVMPTEQVRFGHYEPGTQVTLVGAGAWDPEMVKTVAEDGTVALQVPTAAAHGTALYFRIGDDLYRAKGTEETGIEVQAQTNGLAGLRPQAMSLAAITPDPAEGAVLLVATVDGGDKRVAASLAAPTVSDLVRIRWASALGPAPAESGGYEFCQFSLPYADDDTGELVPDTYNLLLKAPTNNAVFFWLEW